MTKKFTASILKMENDPEIAKGLLFCFIFGLKVCFPNIRPIPLNNTLKQWYRVGFKTIADMNFWFEYGQILFLSLTIYLMFRIVLGSLFSIECFTYYIFHILI